MNILTEISQLARNLGVDYNSPEIYIRSGTLGKQLFIQQLKIYLHYQGKLKLNWFNRGKGNIEVEGTKITKEQVSKSGEIKLE